MARVDDAKDYFELTPLTQDMHWWVQDHLLACLISNLCRAGGVPGGLTSHHPDHVIDISIVVVVVTINIITVIIRNPDRIIEMESVV